MAKKKQEKALNIDDILFKCRDILRKAANSGSNSDKRDFILTLVFLRFIGEKYEDGIEHLRQQLREQGFDPDDENIRIAFLTILPLQMALITCLWRHAGQLLSILRLRS